jgi:hypothetical protein
VRRLVLGAIALSVISSSPVGAQNPAVDELKGKIFDAHMAQQTFAAGLKFCGELDGENFYFAPRNRVLNLEEYHRSLENLAGAHAFNPQTHRPWTLQDANDRWEQVKRQALSDRENCALVASLPELERRLQEMQQRAAAPEKREQKQ